MTSTSPAPRAVVHPGSSQWTYLTNHAHVLLAIARDHDVRLREIASQVGITERAVQKIIAELEESGALTKSRDGRRNHYEVNTEVSLRHPMEAHRTLDALVRMVLDDAATANGDGAHLLNGQGDVRSNGHAPETINGRSSALPNGRAATAFAASGSVQANGHANGHFNGHAVDDGAGLVNARVNGSGGNGART